MKLREIIVVCIKHARRDNVISENQALQALNWLSDVISLGNVVLRTDFTEREEDNESS